MPPKSSEAKRSLASFTKRKDPSGSDSVPSNSNADSQPRKRLKLWQHREIASQHPNLALKDGELNLQAFLNSQEFAIKAFEESMRHTKGESTTRAFQQVPRGLRRRAASHNVKRVPKKLRWKAIKEMKDNDTPTVSRRRRKPTTTRARVRAETAKKLGILADKKRKRKLKLAKARDGNTTSSVEPTATITTRPARPKIRRNRLNEPPRPKSKFRKRQMNKTWLPTHLWHAKRARMTPSTEPLWRFAIPLSPNEKIYRATHRAQGEKGTMVWDMSYTSTIGLYGNQKGIEQVLRKLGVSDEACWSNRGRRWREGTRHWSGFLSRDTKAGRRGVCPVNIIWNPQSSKRDDGTSNEGQAPIKTVRQLFLRVHPSAFHELFTELLRLVKMQNPQLYIEDLRFEVGSIELTGPASTEALLSLIHPYQKSDAAREPHAEIFKRLTTDVPPASLPPNAVLAFSVLDPRIRYPPRKVPQPDRGDEDAQAALLNMLAAWPTSDNLVPYGLFERDARFKASALPSEKAINRRKGARPPRTDLDPSDADPPIPVILLSSRPAQGTQAQGTWTLLAPFKCILPLWKSLVHVPLWCGGNPRFGGLEETRQVPFERGMPCFPYDFIGTDAGAAWEAEQRAKRKRDWERRPKSKKVAWESLDLGAGRKGEVGDGCACDLEHVFGLKRPDVKAVPDTDAMDVDSSPAQGSTGKSKSTAEKPQQETSAEEALKLVHKLPRASFQALVQTPADAPPANAVITVNLSLIGRGVALPCARIYRLPARPTAGSPLASTSLPADLRDQWLAQRSRAVSPRSRATKSSGAVRVPGDTNESSRRRLLAQALAEPPQTWPPPKPNQDDMCGHPLVPDEQDLVGFVTTGAFSLSEGRGTAIGCLAVEKVIDGVREGRKPGGRGEGQLCIVRNAGESVGWLARWEGA